MTVRKTWNMTCPACGEDDGIMVSFTGTCRITVDGTEEEGDHEWEDKSPAHCEHCDYQGTVKDFSVKA